MEELRPSLTLYAYNILGSYEEAKDVVQDVFLKFSLVDQKKIEDKKLYLIRMVVNLAIDQKRKQKKRLTNYPGPWLPEPISTEDPENGVYKKEILSYSLMVLLEKLDSKQRAVFILKEAFDYSHEEIADVLGITVEHSRKILSRARNDLRSGVSPQFAKDQRNSLHRYVTIMERGDIKELERMLHEEVAVIADGGGKASAFMKKIFGVKSVSALLSGLYKKMVGNVHTEEGWVNYQPTLFQYFEGKLVTCQIFSMKGEQIDGVFLIRNPDKMPTILQKIS